MNVLKKDFEWHLVTIYDPHFLSGQSFYNIINLLLKLLRVQFVLLSDLQGAGISNLIGDKEIPVVAINEFLKRICLVDQFDWGDFFLFSKFPDDWQTFEKKQYQEVIAFTETTIRAVDDTYIYIYTPYREIVQVIKENYVCDEIKNGDLNSLDYPY